MPRMHTHHARMNAHDLDRLGRIFAEARGITLRSLGSYMVRDAYFFERLESGRVTFRRAGRALQWLADNWPADREWPADIPRPARTDEAAA